MAKVLELRTKGNEEETEDLEALCREGARQMLMKALQAEVADYFERNPERDEAGRALVVRNGQA